MGAEQEEFTRKLGRAGVLLTDAEREAMGNVNAGHVMEVVDILIKASNGAVAGALAAIYVGSLGIDGARAQAQRIVDLDGQIRQLGKPHVVPK